MSKVPSRLPPAKYVRAIEMTAFLSMTLPEPQASPALPLFFGQPTATQLFSSQPIPSTSTMADLVQSGQRNIYNATDYKPDNKKNYHEDYIQGLSFNAADFPVQAQRSGKVPEKAASLRSLSCRTSAGDSSSTQVPASWKVISSSRLFLSCLTSCEPQEGHLWRKNGLWMGC
jgi:hypothetical protein